MARLCRRAEGDHDGQADLQGTRLTVEFVLKQLGTEMSHAELLEQYPTLKAEHLRAAVLYAADVVAMDRSISS